MMDQLNLAQNIDENRLEKEIDAWTKKKDNGFYKIQNIYEWHMDRIFKIKVRRIIVRIFPDDDSPYYFSSKMGYDVELIIPESYPWSAPYIRFTQKVWHPGINLVNGMIGEDFSPVSQRNWLPSKNLKDIINEIKYILSLQFINKTFSNHGVNGPTDLNNRLHQIGEKHMNNDRDENGEIKSPTVSLQERLAKKKADKLQKNKSLSKLPSIVDESSLSGKRQMSRTDSILKEARNEQGNSSAHNQWVTSKSLFKTSIKNYNLKCEDTLMDMAENTALMLKKSQILSSRASRFIADSADYLNCNKNLKMTRSERASALDKIIHIGESKQIFEKKDQMSRIEKKYALEQILAENSLDDNGMTLLDRKASIAERRNSRIEELEALAVGTAGSFSDMSESDEKAALNMLAQKAKSRRRSSIAPGLNGLLE